MAVVEELIRKEADGTLSFGNYELATKSKRSDFEYEGDLYKIKTFAEITKLEKNGMFVYESVPGTTVTNMKCNEDGITLTVEGKEDAQVTLELEAEKEYDVCIHGRDSGVMKTNLGGKLNISVELDAGVPVQIAVVEK
ncbi:MAG: endosialidase [Clostridiales bacterium]|nr:endosialidase [Clostridiales bacterium]MDE7422383.1 endosialidase [Lachnospiraceae bacterium]